jgi:hypothetical protein
MAFENIAGATNIQRRWALAFGFGLIHGFGFSFALRDTLQFAGAHLLTSLLSFNIGVELGQIAVLIVLIPVLNLLFRYVVPERIGTIILSGLIAHTGWHWAMERGSQLMRFPWPRIDAALLLGGVRLLMVVVVATAAVWLLFGVVFKASVASGASRAGREAGGPPVI